METQENNSDTFDKRKWFTSLDHTWKRILKQSIDINSAPNDDQLDEILNLVEIDCSNSYVISVEPLIYLKKLEKLICKKTKIKTLDKLVNNSRLVYLDLSSTEIINLDFLRNFPKLLTLNVSNTKIETLSGIADCEVLEYLYFNNTSIEDISTLKYNKKLYTVELNDTQVSDISILNTLGVKHIFFDNTPAKELYEENKIAEYERKLEVKKTKTNEYKPMVFEEEVPKINEDTLIKKTEITPILNNNPIQKNIYNTPNKDYTSYYFLFGGLLVLLLLMLSNLRDFGSKAIESSVPYQTNFKYGVINSESGLNLREEPNSNSNIIVTIPRNTKIKIIATNGPIEIVDGLIKHWYKIEYDNKEGWCWGGYIKTN